jgi:dipeptidyl aminopeptidase/acylaminoacyl peptidase
MNDDLVDAGELGGETGTYRKESRRCLWGWSYGGYATLAALAFSPDVFACGMADVFSDLICKR